MKDQREHFLMNRDEKVMLFSSAKNEYGEILLEELDVFGNPLPLGFEDIQSFIAHRQAPKHRKHIPKLLRQAECEDLQGFLEVSKALNLNDTFWVKSADSQLCWREVSLYQNDFNEVIAQIAFDGGDYFSDFYASQLAEILCPDAVNYEIGEWHGRIVSCCPLFTSESKGYVPAIRLLDERKHNKVAYLMEYFSRIGLEDEFRRMIVLDALIVNEDRHAGNYGFMVDNRTQEILGMAPMFDHNRSLLYGLKSPEKVSEYLKQQIPRIGMDFNITAHSLLTPRLRQDLLNLKGFHFRQDGEFDLPKERITMLEQVVNRQIDNILSGTSLYHYGA